MEIADERKSQYVKGFPALHNVRRAGGEIRIHAGQEYHLLLNEEEMGADLTNESGTARGLTRLDIPGCLENDEKIYSAIAPLNSSDPDIQMLYWGAFSLMRQVMLPPATDSHFCAATLTLSFAYSIIL